MKITGLTASTALLAVLTILGCSHILISSARTCFFFEINEAFSVVAMAAIRESQGKNSHTALCLGQETLPTQTTGKKHAGNVTPTILNGFVPI